MVNNFRALTNKEAETEIDELWLLFKLSYAYMQKYLLVIASISKKEEKKRIFSEIKDIGMIYLQTKDKVYGKRK